LLVNAHSFSVSSLEKVCFWTILLSLIATPARLNSQASSTTHEGEVDPPSLRVIVESLTDAHRRDSSNLRPYKAVRRYQIFRHDNEKPVFSATAEINVVPNGTSNYNIVEAKGSSRGKKIVRKILDTETRPTKRTSSGEIDNVNYDFAFVRREELNGHRTYILGIVPKSKAPELLKGLIWVDEANYRIRKIEGTPNKKPSWWVKSLRITLRFAEVKGMWLHTSLEATAIVRIFGKYRLTGEDEEVKTTAFSGSSGTVYLQTWNNALPL